MEAMEVYLAQQKKKLSTEKPKKEN